MNALKKEKDTIVKEKDAIIEEKDEEIRRMKEANKNLSETIKTDKPVKRTQVNSQQLSELNAEFSDGTKIKTEGNIIIHHGEKRWETCSIGPAVIDV